MALRFYRRPQRHNALAMSIKSQTAGDYIRNALRERTMQEGRGRARRGSVESRAKGSDSDHAAWSADSRSFSVMAALVAAIHEVAAAEPETDRQRRTQPIENLLSFAITTGFAPAFASIAGTKPGYDDRGSKTPAGTRSFNSRRYKSRAICFRNPETVLWSFLLARSRSRLRGPTGK